MLKVFIQFRFLSFVSIACSLIGSLLMFVIGTTKTYHAFNAVSFNIVQNQNLSYLKPSDIATTYLIKSLDAFLIALVLFIFAYRVFSLFLSKDNDKNTSNALDQISWEVLLLPVAIVLLSLGLKFLELRQES